MLDYLFNSNTNNPLSNKEFPCKLNFLHNEKPNRDETLHCVGQTRPTPCERRLAHCKVAPLLNISRTKLFYRNPLLYLLMSNLWINNIKHHPHTQQSLGH